MNLKSIILGAALALSPVGAYALTPTQVAAQEAAVEAVSSRVQIATPGTTQNTTTTICSQGDAGVECRTNIDQHIVTGQSLYNPESRLQYNVDAIRYQTRAGAPAGALRVTTNTNASDILDPNYDPPESWLGPGFYNLEATVGGARVTNYDVGPWQEVRNATWLAKLQDANVPMLTARDKLFQDDLKEVLAVKACDNILSSNTTCYSTIVNIFNTITPDVYRAEITCKNNACGKAIVELRPAYDGQGNLANTGTMEFLTSAPEWTLNKDLSFAIHELVEFGDAWFPGANGGSTIAWNPDGQSNLSTVMRFQTLYTGWDQGRLQP